MKYRITLLLLTVLTLALPAQGTVERAKTRTERKANSRVDGKIDREVDKAFNAIEGLFKKKKQPAASTEVVAETDRDTLAQADEASAAFMNMLGGGDEDFEAFRNEKPFTLVMTVTEEKRGKSQVNHIRIGASTDKIAMVTEDESGQSSQMIFDTNDGKTTMVTTDKKGNKQGYRLRMPNLGSLMQSAKNEVVDHLKIERTGERRTIDGYACELIIVENTKDNVTTRSWVTKDVGLNGQDVFGSMARMLGGGAAGGAKMPFPPGLGDLVDGLAIEATSVDGNKNYTMTLTDIRTGGNIDASLFDTGDVRIQDTGF